MKTLPNFGGILLHMHTGVAACAANLNQLAELGISGVFSVNFFHETYCIITFPMPLWNYGVAAKWRKDVHYSKKC